MRTQPSLSSIGSFRGPLKTAYQQHYPGVLLVVELAVVLLVVPLVVALVVPPEVVALTNDKACSDVSGATYLITYLIESTVFTSTTLLPFLIVTFPWPLANDPPLTLI